MHNRGKNSTRQEDEEKQLHVIRSQAHVALKQGIREVHSHDSRKKQGNNRRYDEGGDPFIAQKDENRN